MYFKFSKQILRLTCVGILLAQTQVLSFAQATDLTVSKPDKSLARYIDQTGGITADAAVVYALGHNDELAALRKEADAAAALVKQAGLRANPELETSGTKQIGGTDNTLMVQGMLPLELGGRRGARIKVAEREAVVREKAVADRERLLAADVRLKFGEAIAQTLKLKLIDDLLNTALQGYDLVKARVADGKTAPLEQNMTLVEVNRLRSTRETEAGKTEIAFLELRNLLGMKPEEPLRLQGDFGNLAMPLPSVSDATATALQNRPDLAAMKSMEDLANAQIEQARSEGRLDASVSAGYQRMNFSFPLNGLTDAGQLRPIQDIFHSITFGVTLQLPVRNRNQGAIEAAVATREAAQKRREFGELVIRREVAAAFAKYESTARAMEIFRVGVREQANSNLDVVRQTYELGARNLIDYLVEERRYIQLETEFIDSQLTVYQARVEILRATNIRN
jgi:cobalt-zinc-cadmium efflux system outer membrane protein